MLSDAEKDYLAAERLASGPSEYLHGETYPLPAPTPEHSLLADNTALLLASQVRGRDCQVLGSHTLVDGWSGPQHASVHALLAKCYPDSTNSLSALCGKHKLKKHFGQL